MHRSLILAGIMLVPSFFVATNVFAQKEQVAVIGIGLGIHRFSETDDARRNLFFDEIAGFGQLYGEWYPFERLGFGIHAVAIGLSETVVFFGFNQTTEIDIGSFLITLQFLPFISADGYTRVGLLGGVGPSTYELSVTDNNTNTTQSADTSGTAVLGGVYIDWGGEDFGARFGINALKTDFDSLQGLEVDGSGTNFYFDLRWAFG